MLLCVQVFLHDPLFQWELSEAKAKKSQPERKRPDDSSAVAAGPPPPPGGNVSAQRAARRVSDKLRGLDFGGGDALSVPGVVQQLILSASDVQNLSRQFVGWSGWV